MPNSSYPGWLWGAVVILAVALVGTLGYACSIEPEEPVFPAEFSELPEDVQESYSEQVIEEIIGGRSCTWPWHCDGMGVPPGWEPPAGLPPEVIEMLQESQAIDVLNKIEEWIQDEPISAGRKGRIANHCGRCRDPMLTSADGIHVCDIQDPEPCRQLKMKVFLAAAAAKFADPGQQPPPEKEVLWEVVEDEFRKFPGDR